MTRPAGLAAVGRVAKAHGVRGECAVALLTDAPGAYFAPGARVFAGRPDGTPHPATAPAGGPPLALTVAAARTMGGPDAERLLVTFREVADRTAAERLRGHTLLVPEAELVPPADDAVRLDDLLGLAAERPDGTPIGPVKDVFEVPQGLLLEVEAGGRAVLVPFVEGIVVAVDPAARRIVLDPPDGLLDDAGA